MMLYHILPMLSSIHYHRLRTKTILTLLGATICIFAFGVHTAHASVESYTRTVSPGRMVTQKLTMPATGVGLSLSKNGDVFVQVLHAGDSPEEGRVLKSKYENCCGFHLAATDPILPETSRVFLDLFYRMD